MARSDITNRLIHFVTGTDYEDAFSTLCQIVDERVLLGGTGHIRGQQPCVCFTEAPIPSLSQGLVNPSSYSRYQPFGIIVDKLWLFQRGGRPVIYQPASDYKHLQPELQWRHVRYEPDRDPPIDFTWEREWRIQAEEVHLDPGEAGIVVPERSWADHIIEAYDEQQDFLIEEYALVLGRSIAEQYRETFSWPVVILHTARAQHNAQADTALIGVHFGWKPHFVWQRHISL